MEVFPELEVPFRKSNIPCFNKIIIAYLSDNVIFTMFIKLSNSENIRETIESVLYCTLNKEKKRTNITAIGIDSCHLSEHILV